jgi:hypothetical protein
MRAWWLGMLVAVGCGEGEAGGDGVGETTLLGELCLQDGTYRVTYTPAEGSEAFCAQMAVQDTFESRGDEVDKECDPSCSCDYQPSLTTCTAEMAVSCADSGFTSTTDCEFSLDGDSMSGSCVITVEGAMSLTCSFTVSGVRQ